MKRLCKIVFLTAALINPAFMYTDQIKPLLDVAGDINNDGTINIVDVISIVNFILD